MSNLRTTAFVSVKGADLGKADAVFNYSPNRVIVYLDSGQSALLRRDLISSDCGRLHLAIEYSRSEKECPIKDVPEHNEKRSNSEIDEKLPVEILCWDGTDTSAVVIFAWLKKWRRDGFRSAKGLFNIIDAIIVRDNDEVFLIRKGDSIGRTGHVKFYKIPAVLEIEEDLKADN